jgi:hypothetical protein
MFIRIFGLFALAFALSGTQCWAAPCGVDDEPPCPGITNTFFPGQTHGVYDFTGTGDGRLVVDFVTVLTTFTLTVTVNHNIDNLAEGVFPEGTVSVIYANGQKDQYDFTGDAGGPNHVPVKNVDYKGLITLTLSYLTFESAITPAFLHAPGDNATAVYTEDILTSYSTNPVVPDPTMKGKLPGLSSVAAFDEPGANDCYVPVSPTEGQTFHVGHVIEVEFRLSTTCGGAPIRDKDARLTLSTTDSNGNTIIVPVPKEEEGNKFHFDRDEGVNERDLCTEGLAPGSYTITVFSDEFSPQSVDITLIPGRDRDPD